MGQFSAENSRSPVQIRVEINRRIEFRHLNNGITIIADSIHGVGPKDKLSAIDVAQPGIVNGLQTVKSLHDGYKELNDPRDQAHFEEACSVLCRVHGTASVSDVNQLIKATNNQNAMKPRNLRSNDPEQLIYEQLFAELNWFYQRKEALGEHLKAVIKAGQSSEANCPRISSPVKQSAWSITRRSPKTGSVLSDIPRRQSTSARQFFRPNMTTCIAFVFC